MARLGQSTCWAWHWWCERDCPPFCQSWRYWSWTCGGGISKVEHKVLHINVYCKHLIDCSWLVEGKNPWLKHPILTSEIGEHPPFSSLSSSRHSHPCWQRRCFVYGPRSRVSQSLEYWLPGSPPRFLGFAKQPKLKTQIEKIMFNTQSMEMIKCTIICVYIYIHKNVCVCVRWNTHVYI